jgi:hypothetical protein
MVGQTTADGEKEILVDQSSGFRFALSPEVKLSARVVWVRHKLCSPIVESKKEVSSPLPSALSSFNTGDEGTGGRHHSSSSGYQVISFHFDTKQHDDSKVTTWHRAKVMTTKHPSALPDFNYFDNKTYVVFENANTYKRKQNTHTHTQ